MGRQNDEMIGLESTPHLPLFIPWVGYLITLKPEYKVFITMLLFVFYCIFVLKLLFYLEAIESSLGKVSITEVHRQADNEPEILILFYTKILLI